MKKIILYLFCVLVLLYGLLIEIPFRLYFKRSTMLGAYLAELID